MLEQLAAQGVQRAFVTLHVGAGTFQPVRVQNLAEHIMHAEWYTVPEATVAAIARARAHGGRIVAVGTTSVRALESAAAQAQDGRWPPRRAIRGCSSRPATATGPSTPCSPISTCRNPRC